MPFVGAALWHCAEFHAKPEQQQIEQAQRNFINAILRRGSGAVILRPGIRQRASSTSRSPATAGIYSQKCQPAANHRRIAHRAGSTGHVTGADRACRAPTGVWKTDRMPKAWIIPSKYLTMPDGRVLQSVNGNGLWGQLMPKFILSDEPPQLGPCQDAFVLSDAPPAADNRNLLEKAAQWASNTFRRQRQLRGVGNRWRHAGHGRSCRGLVQMGANLPGVSRWSAIRSMRASPETGAIRGGDRRQGAADLMLLASSVTSQRRQMIAAARVPMAATRVGQTGAGAAAGAVGAALDSGKDARLLGRRSCRKGLLAVLLALCWRLSLSAPWGNVCRRCGTVAAPPPPAAHLQADGARLSRCRQGSHAMTQPIAQAAAETEPDD